MDKPTLYVVAGPNGAGKSSYSRIIKENDYEFLNPDEFVKNKMSKGSSEMDAYKDFIREVDKRIEDRKTFAFETTLAGNRAINLMSKAKDLGYDIKLTFFSLESKEMHYERVSSRVAKGGHDVPKEMIDRRFEDAYKNLPKAIELSNRATIFNNSSLGRNEMMTIREGVIERLNEKVITEPLKNAFPEKSLEVGSNLSEGLTSSIKMTL